jgi:hypothetical protein
MKKLKSNYGFIFNTNRKLYSFTKVFSGGEAIIPYKEDQGSSELQIAENTEVYGEKVSILAFRQIFLCLLYVGDVSDFLMMF